MHPILLNISFLIEKILDTVIISYKVINWSVLLNLIVFKSIFLLSLSLKRSMLKPSFIIGICQFSHCGICFSLMTNYVGQLFIVDHLCMFFGEISIRVLCSLLNYVICLLIFDLGEF